MRALGLVLALPATALAAGWGPDGHPRITEGVATSDELAVPADVARVMAFGSVAPDYLEFDVPAAHSQTPDPPIEGGKLVVSRRVFEAQQREAQETARRWHDFYLDAAVAAMKDGHRERAAFLLGYALHNVEDLATHRGMTNLQHAALDKAEASPDKDPRNLAAAHRMAALDMNEFRRRVGDESWRLFRGEAVRHPGAIGSIVPEPLVKLGPQLAGWDPRTGVLPPPRDRLALRALDALLEKVPPALYSADLRGRIHDSLRVRAANLLALHESQDAMRSFLELVRGPDDPALPPAKDEAAFELLLSQLCDFAFFAPSRHDDLSAEDKETLRTLTWDRVLAERLARLREEREARRKELAAVLAAKLARLQAERARTESLLRRHAPENGLLVRPGREQAARTERVAARPEPKTAWKSTGERVGEALSEVAGAVGSALDSLGEALQSEGGGEGGGGGGGGSRDTWDEPRGPTHTVPSVNLDKWRNPNFDGLRR